MGQQQRTSFGLGMHSTWLAAITECGALQGRFAPTQDVRQLQACTCCRHHLTRERT
jgi:hypothetical protein